MSLCAAIKTILASFMYKSSLVRNSFLARRHACVRFRMNVWLFYETFKVPST